MRIALLAPLWKTIPPEKYGGSELVVANLAKGLVKLGHTVTTFACAGSQVEGELVTVIPKSIYELKGGFDWNGIQPYEFLSYFALAKRKSDFDVVHNHMGIHPVALAPLLPVPMVTTLHSSLPPDFPSLADAFRFSPYVSISDAQRALAPDLNYVGTVHHGIDIASFAPRYEGSGKGFVFLGTLSPQKGIDIAIRTSQALGIPLTIAGEVRASDQDFLEKEVFPHVDGKMIRFINEIGPIEKARLLKEADALLFPSRWHEAFGLVMIEAMACGTPVVALTNGAAPEVIMPGKTGWLASDEAEFIARAKQVHEISRRTCREEAERVFDLLRMAEQYQGIYQSLL